MPSNTDSDPILSFKTRLEKQEAERSQRLPQLFSDAVCYNVDALYDELGREPTSNEFYHRWAEKLKEVGRELRNAGLAGKIKEVKERAHTFEERIAGIWLYSACIPSCSATHLQGIIQGSREKYRDQIRHCLLRIGREFFGDQEKVITKKNRGRPKLTVQKQERQKEIAEDWYRFYDSGAWKDIRKRERKTAKEQFCESEGIEWETLESALRQNRRKA